MINKCLKWPPFWNFKLDFSEFKYYSLIIPNTKFHVPILICAVTIMFACIDSERTGCLKHFFDEAKTCGDWSKNVGRTVFRDYHVHWLCNKCLSKKLYTQYKNSNTPSWRVGRNILERKIDSKIRSHFHNRHLNNYVNTEGITYYQLYTFPQK